MSPTPVPDDDVAPPLLHRLTWTTLACSAAAALFILVSGVHAGGGAKDKRLLVAQCWHDIEQTQATGTEAHYKRVACQALESGLDLPAGRSPNTRPTVVASQD